MVKNLMSMAGLRRSVSFVYNFIEVFIFEIFADSHNTRRKYCNVDVFTKPSSFKSLNFEKGRFRGDTISKGQILNCQGLI